VKDNKIKAKDASITMATVNLQVIRIGTKAMTLAVFRQLPSGILVDHISREVVGDLWGRVNYHGSLCEGLHVHVIGVLRGELCQQAISLRGTHEMFDSLIPYSMWSNVSDEEQEKQLQQVWPFWERLLSLPQIFIAV
jgi:hypothetical protein